MADSRRRTAADARRVAGKLGGDDITDELRKLLRRAHERGVEEGRRQMAAENQPDRRGWLLDTLADILDASSARASGIPNSGRTQQAIREAAHIVRDAKTLGEPPQPGERVEEEAAAAAEELKAKAPRKSAKGRKKNG